MRTPGPFAERAGPAIVRARVSHWAGRGDRSAAGLRGDRREVPRPSIDAWIERKRAEALRNAVPAQPFPPSRVELDACAESWRVHLSGGAGKPRIRVLALGVLGISGDVSNAQSTRDALRRWLTMRASKSLPL